LRDNDLHELDAIELNRLYKCDPEKTLASRSPNAGDEKRKKKIKVRLETTHLAI
jgi:hypothetical protein